MIDGVDWLFNGGNRHPYYNDDEPVTQALTPDQPPRVRRKFIAMMDEIWDEIKDTYV